MNIDFDRLRYSLTGEYEEVILEKQLEEKDKEIERLHSIIKEVREYTGSHFKEMVADEEAQKLLEILEKENKE